MTNNMIFDLLCSWFLPFKLHTCCPIFLVEVAAYDQRQINCLRHCSVTWKTQTVLLLSNDLCRAPCFRLIFRCVCYLVMKEIMDYSCVKMCILKYIKSFHWTFFFKICHVAKFHTKISTFNFFYKWPLNQRLWFK